jgi:predicted dehydrogenase
VREALAAKYAPARPYAGWPELLEREELEVLAVCSPEHTHAEAVLAALETGLHVFVEKPLCVAVEDADAIVERARATGLTVQVGYMKRFSRGYAALLDALPRSPDGLRLIDVVTYDPWMSREPFVPWRSMTPADDLPAADGADLRRQVARAVGRDDPETVRAYGYTFLACLVHDVNLIHGVLDRLDLGDAAEPRESAVWADGDAAAASLRLPGGAIWRTSWMLLRGLMDFEERASVYLDGAIHELRFPVPYHTDAPVEHSVTTGEDGAHAVRQESFVDDPYVAELEHFHACVTAGADCRTPAAQARRDLAVLRDLFLKRDTTKED